MSTFNKNTFVGQRIQIDGHIFDDNVFKNCVLVYGGGPLNFSNNTLHGVRWEFVDEALRTIGLLSSFFQSGGESKEFVETLLSTYGKKAQSPSAVEHKEDSSNG